MHGDSESAAAARARESIKIVKNDDDDESQMLRGSGRRRADKLWTDDLQQGRRRGGRDCGVDAG